MLAPNPAWTLARDDGALLLWAGADLRYAVADVPPAVADEVLAAWQAGRLDRAELSASAGEVLDQLATAGALRPAGPLGTPAQVSTVFVGAAVDGFPAGDLGAEGVRGPGPVAMIVVVRTTGTLADLAERAEELGDVPHLVVDVAYHHTVSLGPLVVPGQTSCAGCLAGRIAARWGDDPPPPEPTAARAPAAAAIVAHEVAKVATGTSRLVDRTVAIDLDTWRTVEQTVLRLPWCASCGRRHGGASPSGSIDLPWAAAER